MAVFGHLGHFASFGALLHHISCFSPSFFFFKGKIYLTKVVYIYGIFSFASWISTSSVKPVNMSKSLFWKIVLLILLPLQIIKRDYLCVINFVDLCNRCIIFWEESIAFIRFSKRSVTVALMDEKDRKMNNGKRNRVIIVKVLWLL